MTTFAYALLQSDVVGLHRVDLWKINRPVCPSADVVSSLFQMNFIYCFKNGISYLLRTT